MKKCLMMSKTRPEQNGEGSPQIICLDDDLETVSTNLDEISVIELEPDSPESKPLLLMQQTRYASSLTSPSPPPTVKDNKLKDSMEWLQSLKIGDMKNYARQCLKLTSKYRTSVEDCFSIYYRKPSIKSVNEVNASCIASSTLSQDNLVTEAAVATVPIPTTLDWNTPLLSTEKLLEIMQNVSSCGASTAEQNQNFSPSFTPRSSPAFSKIHLSQAAASLCETEGNSGVSILDSGSPCPPEKIMKKRAQLPAAPNESSKKQKLSIMEYARRRTSIPDDSVAAALVSTSSFEPRLGSKKCLAYYSYTDIGCKIISGDIIAYVLQWNPSWFATQRKMLEMAPICDWYDYVRYTYRNEEDYYNTYVRLLFLSIWMKMDEAKENSPVITAEVINGNVVQLSHFSYMQYNAKGWIEHQWIQPKQDDIILCKTTAGKIQQAFCHVTKVTCETSAGAGSTIRFKMMFRCFGPLNCEMHNRIEFKVLCNMRLANLQNKALYNLSGMVKDVVLDPKTFKSKVELLQFLHGKREDMKAIRDKILYSVLYSDTRAVLINSDTLQCEMVDLLAHLAYQLNMKNAFVLVCVWSEDVLLRLAKRLKPYKPVVAVCSQEMCQPLGSDLAKFSLEELLRSKPVTEIYQRGSPRITLTLYTAAFFNQAGEVFKKKGMICILADSDTCTEVESALPLMYGAKKMILFGRPKADMMVPPVLKKYHYNISLYQRLLKCKDC